jgi:hypothetical protein
VKWSGADVSNLMCNRPVGPVGVKHAALLGLAFDGLCAEHLDPGAGRFLESALVDDVQKSGLGMKQIIRSQELRLGTGSRSMLGHKHKCA